MVRNTDKTEAQMLLEVITGAVERRRHHPRRGRLHLRRQLRLRGRPGVLVRAEHRRHRRVAAQARLARRDGRRVGAVRGVGPAAARRHRRRAWRWARAGRRPPTPRSSTRWRWTRSTSRRSAPTRVSFAALQARALIDAGKVTERQMAEVAARSRRDAQGQPARAGRPATSTSTSCSPSDYVRAPLRRHDLPPITDGAVRGRDRPRPTRRASCATTRSGSRGFAHYSELHYPGMRDLTTSPSTTLGGQGGRARRGAGRGGRDPGGVHPRGAAARRGARSRRRRRRQPVGRPAGRPTRSWRPAWSASPRPRGRSATTAKPPHARALDVGSVPAAEPGLRPGREQLMSHQPCAIVGIGQTQHKTPPLGRVARRAGPRGGARARSTTPR